jgi:hypothetical protein
VVAGGVVGLLGFAGLLLFLRRRQVRQYEVRGLAHRCLSVKCVRCITCWDGTYNLNHHHGNTHPPHPDHIMLRPHPPPPHPPTPSSSLALPTP